MVCPHCGQSVAVDASICPQCGEVLRVSGLRVQHPRGVDLATAKRATLTPTHPRLPQAPIAADSTDPWRSEWLATAKRPLTADETSQHATRPYLLPGVSALVLLVFCAGLALLLHGTLFASHVAPAKAPVSATQTLVPTATTTSAGAVSTTAPLPTATSYTPPRHAPTATLTAVPTATSPVNIVTATVNPILTPTVGDTRTPTPKPTATAKPTATP